MGRSRPKKGEKICTAKSQLTPTFAVLTLFLDYLDLFISLCFLATTLIQVAIISGLQQPLHWSPQSLLVQSTFHTEVSLMRF